MRPPAPKSRTVKANRAAYEASGGEAECFEHTAGNGHMELGSRVGAAGERNLLVAKTEFVSSAGLHEGQRLEQLDGRAREYGASHVAKGQQRRTIDGGNNERAGMSALNEQSTSNFNKSGIGRQNQRLPV